MYPSILLTISTSTLFYRKDVLFSSENRTSFCFLSAMRGGLRFIRDKQGLKAIIEHMDGSDAG